MKQMHFTEVLNFDHPFFEGALVLDLLKYGQEKRFIKTT
jgi:hypothetical protein